MKFRSVSDQRSLYTIRGITINSIDSQMINMTTVHYDSWFDVNIGPIDVERYATMIGAR